MLFLFVYLGVCLLLYSFVIFNILLMFILYIVNTQTNEIMFKKYLDFISLCVCVFVCVALYKSRFYRTRNY